MVLGVVKYNFYLSQNYNVTLNSMNFHHSDRALLMHLLALRPIRFKHIITNSVSSYRNLLSNEVCLPNFYLLKLIVLTRQMCKYCTFTQLILQLIFIIV